MARWWDGEMETAPHLRPLLRPSLLSIHLGKIRLQQKAIARKLIVSSLRLGVYERNPEIPPNLVRAPVYLH